jgi:ADP-ribose pyrophosphatase YjhB (NUDIX family)
VNPKIRATAVLIEEDHILLLEQRVNDVRGWSLPGGTLEIGESLGACLVREMREETGLDVAVERLLYVCDRIESERHVVHITFVVRRVGGEPRVGLESEASANQIKGVRMVPIGALDEYGFSRRFCELVAAGFPASGTYRGDVRNIGL